ncbi:MAG: OmpA family protein [Alphaproteobacteria bacterium]|nr:OmpA family protein [Alphaproteobacteria bacterium]MBV9553589.1 OmpA family protein [Alphaproteobacteria bacterium]
MKRALALCALLAMASCAPVPAPAPPPPPPPPPAPAAAAKVFTVYFAWNRSWVGPQGMAILHQAADTFRAGGVVTVQVTGYTDTSGSARYNQRLSLRRARHVAHILSRMGVPWNAMAVSGRGENDLAVPTPNGVREPRNRRVTVVEG